MKLTDLDRNKIVLDDDTFLIRVTDLIHNPFDHYQYLIFTRERHEENGAIHYTWRVRGSIGQTCHTNDIFRNVASGYIGTYNKELDELVEEYVDDLNGISDQPSSEAYRKSELKAMGITE